MARMKLYTVIHGVEKFHTQTSSGDYTYVRFVLVALWTVKLGLTKVGNQAEPLKDSEGGGGVFCTNSE